MRWTRRRVNRMKLTERRRKLIPCTGKVMHCERTVGDLYTGGRASVYNNRWGAGSTCGLNRDEIVWVFRLAGCKNFVGEWQEFIFNAIDDHSLVVSLSARTVSFEIPYVKHVLAGIVFFKFKLPSEILILRYNKFISNLHEYTRLHNWGVLMLSWLLLVCCVWHSFTASNYLYYLPFISLFNYYVVAITSWWIKDYHCALSYSHAMRFCVSFSCAFVKFIFLRFCDIS